MCIQFYKLHSSWAIFQTLISYPEILLRPNLKAVRKLEASLKAFVLSWYEKTAVLAISRTPYETLPTAFRSFCEVQLAPETAMLGPMHETASRCIPRRHSLFCLAEVLLKISLTKMRSLSINI